MKTVLWKIIPALCLEEIGGNGRLRAEVSEIVTALIPVGKANRERQYRQAPVTGPGIQLQAAMPPITLRGQARSECLTGQEQRT